MSLFYHGTEVKKVVYHGTDLDYVYYHGTKVFESTIYVPKPSLSGSFMFDNTVKAPQIVGFNSAAMVQSGTASATAAGTYTVTWTLKAGYAWTDGTTAAYSQTWSIAKRAVAVPTLKNTTFTWAYGKTFAPTVNGMASAYVTQGGTASSTNAGSYSVTWSLKYPASTTWADGTTANKSASWKVNKLTLTIPSMSGSTNFAFVEGVNRLASVANYNSTYETQSGTLTASAIGTYTVSWVLKYSANTQWSDGTTSTKSATWKIAWVDGTSHYANDLFNRGWNAGAFLINPRAAVTISGGYINIGKQISGANLWWNADATGKTLHAEIYNDSLNVVTKSNIMNDSSLDDFTASALSGDAETAVMRQWVEIFGSPASAARKYLGVRVGYGGVENLNNRSKIRRIWYT